VRGVNHTPPSSAEVKELVELYLYAPSGPSWPVLGQIHLYLSGGLWVPEREGGLTAAPWLRINTTISPLTIFLHGVYTDDFAFTVKRCIRHSLLYRSSEDTGVRISHFVFTHSVWTHATRKHS
jgi:hypothetical protein